MSHLPDSPAPDETIRRTIEHWEKEKLLASSDHRQSMGSTNSVAMQWLQEYPARAEQDADLPTLPSNLPRLVIADVQTAGRGRRGRSWSSPADGLAFSLVIGGYHELLSLAVGVAIAEAIEHLVAPAKCGLKWPNDVYMGGVKVAGTLIERVDIAVTADTPPQPIVIIGIGINVGSSPALEDAEATSVNAATGKWIQRADLLDELVPAVIENVQKCHTDRGEVLAAFRRRCVLSGEMIGCLIDGQPVQGRCDGIDERGELRVQTQTEQRTCRSGEVSRVRVV